MRGGVRATKGFAGSKGFLIRERIRVGVGLVEAETSSALLSSDRLLACSKASEAASADRTNASDAAVSSNGANEGFPFDVLRLGFGRNCLDGGGRGGSGQRQATGDDLE